MRSVPKEVQLEFFVQGKQFDERIRDSSLKPAKRANEFNKFVLSDPKALSIYVRNLLQTDELNFRIRISEYKQDNTLSRLGHILIVIILASCCGSLLIICLQLWKYRTQIIDRILGRHDRVVAPQPDGRSEEVHPRVKHEMLVKEYETTIPFVTYRFRDELVD